LYVYAFILHVLTILKRQNSSHRILSLAAVVSIYSTPIVKVALTLLRLVKLGTLNVSTCFTLTVVLWN